MIFHLYFLKGASWLPLSSCTTPLPASQDFRVPHTCFSENSSHFYFTFNFHYHLLNVCFLCWTETPWSLVTAVLQYRLHKEISINVHWINHLWPNKSLFKSVIQRANKGGLKLSDCWSHPDLPQVKLLFQKKTKQNGKQHPMTHNQPYSCPEGQLKEECFGDWSRM